MRRGSDPILLVIACRRVLPVATAQAGPLPKAGSPFSASERARPPASSLATRDECRRQGAKEFISALASVVSYLELRDERRAGQLRLDCTGARCLIISGDWKSRKSSGRGFIIPALEAGRRYCAQSNTNFAYLRLVELSLSEGSNSPDSTRTQERAPPPSSAADKSRISRPLLIVFLASVISFKFVLASLAQFMEEVGERILESLALGLALLRGFADARTHTHSSSRFEIAAQKPPEEVLKRARRPTLCTAKNGRGCAREIEREFIYFIPRALKLESQLASERVRRRLLEIALNAQMQMRMSLFASSPRRVWLPYRPPLPLPLLLLSLNVFEWAR